MLSDLRILHPPSSDNPTNLPVLVLTVGANRYLFNTPEATTRIFSQRGARGGANALRHVFLPRVGVEECAGIFGIIMGRADLGMPDLTIHGPPVLTHYLATARSYARRVTLHVKVNEASLRTKSATEGEKANDDEGVFFTDKHISVLAVPVFPQGWEPGNLHQSETASSDSKGLPQSKRARTASTSLSGTCTPTALSQQLLDTMFPGKSTPYEAVNQVEGIERQHGRARSTASDLDNPPLAPAIVEQGVLGQAPALTYIVKGNKVRGRFDVAKAKNLGVPEGRYFTMLTNGEDITIERPCDWSRWDEKTRSKWLVRAKTLACRNDPANTNQKKKLGKSREAVVNDEMFSEQRLEKVTIASNEVLAASRPASAFMQIYLPTPAYLENFLKEDVQNRLTATSSEKDSLVHAIVHAVHPAVLQDERYRDFIKKYPKAHHIMACRPFVPDMLAFPSAALANLRMSRLDDELFKVPQYSLEAQQDVKTLNLGKISVQACGQDIVIPLQPPSAPKRSNIDTPDFNFALGSQQADDMESFKTALALRPNKQSIVQAAANWVKYLQMASELKAANSTASLATSSNGGLLLTALGTGSSAPSKYRNVSGMLLHLPDEKGFILLDCGEGSYGQLMRKFADQVPNILLNMKVIFLSHIHGDHHMGASRILLERQKLSPTETLYVISDGFTRTYLQEVDKIQSLGIARNGSSTNEGSVILLDAEHFDHKHGVVADKLARQSAEESLLSQDELWSKRCEEEARHLIKGGNGSQSHSESSVRDFASALKRHRSGARAAVLRHRNNLQYSLGDCQVFTAEVDHRTPFCYGIVLRGKDWSAAYSGDTRPCENLVNAGQDVDVLIHEATFEENEPGMAHRKGHSTTAQAVNIAQRMRARRLLLTHFSQRYPKIAHVSSNGHEMPIGMAFDLMTMRLDDVGKTTRYREALEMLFESEAEEDEDSADVKDVQMDDAAGFSGKQSKRQGNVDGASSSKANASRSGAEKQASAPHASKDAGSQNNLDSSNAESSRKESPVHRAFVKDHEFQYVVIHIYAPKKRSGPGQIAAPTRWAVLDSVKRCAEELHGLVGSSFRTDVVLYESSSRLSKACSDAETGPDDVCAVLKVATTHAPALVSTIAAGMPISSGGVSFICRYVGTLSAFDLSTITAMLSGTVDGRAGASLSSIAPSGRVWFDSLAS